MVSKRRKISLKDQEIPSQKAKEIKGGIIAILIGLVATGSPMQPGAQNFGIRQ